MPDRAVAFIVTEKVMALSRAEFNATLLNLTDTAPTDDALEIPLERGAVRIHYIEGEDRCLGGLLRLPQATVRLTFLETTDAERAAFLQRFDRAFQRGGG